MCHPLQTLTSRESPRPRPQRRPAVSARCRGPSLTAAWAACVAGGPARRLWATLCICASSSQHSRCPETTLYIAGVCAFASTKHIPRRHHILSSQVLILHEKTSRLRKPRAPSPRAPRVGRQRALALAAPQGRCWCPSAPSQGPRCFQGRTSLGPPRGDHTPLGWPAGPRGRS